jgi:hypothetical protein
MNTERISPQASKALQRASHSITLHTNGGEQVFPIVVTKRARCRNLIIRYQPLGSYITLTIPRHVSIKQGLDFVAQKKSWLEQHIGEITPQVMFTDGARFPVQGDELTIRHVGGRGVVERVDNEIIVPGDADFIERRVRDWVKRYAKNTLTEITLNIAARHGLSYRSITVKDTRSRWGSCTHDGHLSFSWRLIFAPADVLEYVVCHEMAHLEHMDHSAAFWAVVHDLMPNYRPAKRWLKQQGSSLYAYG